MGSSRQAGLTLIEVTVSAVIIGLIAIFAGTLYAMVLKQGKKAMNVNLSTYLATGLMDEIITRRWDEKKYVKSAALGIESGEISGDKSTFDDVDDFQGYTESPVRNPDGSVLSGFDNFKREASVSYVTADNASTANPTPRKRVIVSAGKLGKDTVTIERLFAQKIFY